VKYAFMRDHRTEFRGSRMCGVLHVSRSGFYGWVAVSGRSRRGNCYDNAVAERVSSSLKNKGPDQETFPDRDHARTALFAYIELFYNRQRVHVTLAYQTPEQYERRGVCANPLSRKY